ncbi:MAG TPA: TRAP transporter large permease [Candidatus Binatia bacterium]|nr:TRAP transporter large permease [Candidatus Binatia bacterium]
MTPEATGLLGFLAMLALLGLKVPVGIAMIAVSVVGYGYLIRPTAALARLGSDPFTTVTTYAFSVIPLFILMGLFLANAKLGSDLFSLVNAFVGRLRGGMAMATIGAGALFASVCGSSIATASTIATVTVPEMRKYNYNEGLAAGAAAAGGTLGILIPPSAALVLYGILTEEPIGKLLIAGFLPGVMTAGILMIAAYLVARFKPELAPIPERRERPAILPELRKTWAIPAIFGSSIGGIYGGVFTPTEGGAVGAFLSLLLTLMTRRLSWPSFLAALHQTGRITAVIFLIVVGGKMFGYFLTVTRIPLQLTTFIAALDIAPFVVVFVLFALYFVMGALMDEIAILVIMTPIVYPLIIKLGYDGVWFGVLTIMMLLTGLLTPPVGLLSFIVSGLTGVPLNKVYAGVTPFWIALIVAISLVIIFPEIALFLPRMMR